jgi:hypothetical protein
MAERKPPGGSWQSHIEQQIARAQKEGQFDDLPGAGKPIPDLDRPLGEMWWLRQFLQREELSVEPGVLTLRRDVEKTFERLPKLALESEVRRLLTELNERISRANATLTSGPGSNLAPYDVDDVIARWRKQRQKQS